MPLQAKPCASKKKYQPRKPVLVLIYVVNLPQDCTGCFFPTRSGALGGTRRRQAYVPQGSRCTPRLREREAAILLQLLPFASSAFGLPTAAEQREAAKPNPRGMSAPRRLEVTQMTAVVRRKPEHPAAEQPPPQPRRCLQPSRWFSIHIRRYSLFSPISRFDGTGAPSKSAAAPIRFPPPSPLPLRTQRSAPLL